MPFTNPIVSGTELVRAAIRSPNYVPGASGWSINKDGTAEFDSAVIRGIIDGGTINGGTITGGTINGASITGGDLLISDPAGSSVHIYDDNPGLGAIIEFMPVPLTGHVIVPGYVRGDVSGADTALLALHSPSVDGGAGGALSLLSRPGGTGRTVDLVAGPNGEARIQGAKVRLDGLPGNVSSSVVRDLNNSLFPNCVTTNQAPSSSTASAVYANIGAALSFTKQYNDTRLAIEFSASTFCTVAALTAIEFAVRISTTDFFCTRFFHNVLSEHHATPAGYITIVGLTSGGYSIQPRWRRSTGGGTINTDNNDLLSCKVTEIAP